MIVQKENNMILFEVTFHDLTLLDEIHFDDDNNIHILHEIFHDLRIYYLVLVDQVNEKDQNQVLLISLIYFDDLLEQIDDEKIFLQIIKNMKNLKKKKVWI